LELGQDIRFPLLEFQAGISRNNYSETLIEKRIIQNLENKAARDGGYYIKNLCVCTGRDNILFNGFVG
jgi:hypothetical protein